MTVLPLSNYIRMPWKNGGGETLEIAVFPQASPAGDFDWRISMATVAADGPFSPFPGIDRILTVIDGDAMELSVEGRPPELLDQGAEPYRFAGDVPTSGRLRNGPIVDLNLMVKRGIPHSVTRIEAADLPQCQETSPILFVFALMPIAFSVGPEKLALQRHDTANLSGKQLSDIDVALSGDALLIAIG